MSAVKRTKSPMKSQNEIAIKKAKVNEELVKQTAKEDNFDFLFDDDEDFDLAVLDAAATEIQNVVKLDLGVWQRCIVVDLEREHRSYDLVVRVRAEHTNEKQAKCHLQGPWSHTRVEVGDLLSLHGVWDAHLNAYKVDKDLGFCVSNPDTLISGTTVVGSLFCRRKAVLQDRFRGIEANNLVMFIGSIVHEVFQTALAKRLKTYRQIDGVAQDLLQSKATAHTMYASQLTLLETALEVQGFVPNIQSFVEQYVEGQEPATLHKDNFQGQITQIQDIEENLWVPQLGLKGKVDVSVRIERRRNNLNFDTTNNNAIPLELKTGRASFSMEHKGQVTLYQMMLSATGRETHSGLLFYLSEGILREIPSARNEQRDLIILRNDLGYYLSKMKALPAIDAPLARGDGKYEQPFELPEPISHHSACGNCAYATICCSLAKTDAALQLSEAHPLQKVMQQVTAHLQPQDFEYFIRWCGLLSLEEQEARKSNYLRSLWTDAPETRQRHGRAVTDLQLREGILFEDKRFLHTFALNKEKAGDLDLMLRGFSVGEYVIVSSQKRLAIAAGFVNNIKKSTIAISLERNLRKNYEGQTFIVDKHDSQSSNVFNFTNLSLLLEDNERAIALRNIIVNRQPPTFLKMLPKVLDTKCSAIFKLLNAVQRAAVLKALTTESYLLIKGLPGTGKTQTLLVIIRLFQLMGKSVLITSHTHSAVDNLMLRLRVFSVPMLRLGSDARIHEELHPYGEKELLKECRTVSQITAKYAKFNIVGVTCLGAQHSIFLHRKFDVCIVDEATQVMQPTILRALYFADKFILVGDPDQLPPMVRSREARQRGADESLFKRLDTPAATAMLTVQYRMNKTITKLANELTYAGALQCANLSVKLASMHQPAVGTERWLQRSLQTHIDQSVFLLDTLDCAEISSTFASARHSSICAAIELSFAENDGDNKSTDTADTTATNNKSTLGRRLSKYTNYCEAAIISQIVIALLAAGYDGNRIGIIAPYRAQVELLRKLGAQYHIYHKNHGPALNFAAVEVNTVDQYQGRDKDIILYSCTKTGGTAPDLERSRDAEILQDKRRLTVAITRSKRKLILIGDVNCLEQYTPFHELFARIPSYCKLKLENDKLDFNWQSLLEQLNQIIISS